MNYLESYLISYTSPLLELIGSASILSLPEFALGHRRVEEALLANSGAGGNFRYGLFSERTEYFDLITQFKFKPNISKIFSFDDVPSAFNSMMCDEHMGKIIISMNK